MALCGAVWPTSAAPNRLTPQEVAAGWTLLIDGESDFGWERHMEARWTVRNGELRSDGGGYGWIGTTATFGDFHLKLEFKTVADGNSGVLEGPNWRKQVRLDAGTISLQAHDPTTNLDFKDIRAVELPAR